MKKLMLCLILGIFMISLVSAYSSDFYVQCGGDEEFIILCSGVDVDNVPFGYIEKVEYGKAPEETIKKEKGYILLVFIITLLILIILFLIILIKKKKKKE